MNFAANLLGTKGFFVAMMLVRCSIYFVNVLIAIIRNLNPPTRSNGEGTKEVKPPSHE